MRMPWKDEGRTSTVLLVFDSSAQGRDGKSLNDHLEKGTNYIDSLPNVFMHGALTRKRILVTYAKCSTK